MAMAIQIKSLKFIAKILMYSVVIKEIAFNIIETSVILLYCHDP